VRELHTLKGNSRLYKLNLLSQNIHHAEEEFLKHEYNPAEPSKPVLQVREILSEYENFAKRLSGVQKDDSRELIKVEQDKLDLLLSEISSLKDVLKGSPYLRLQQAAKALAGISLKGTFASFQSMVEEIASRLGKDVEFRMEGSDVYVSRKASAKLQECVLHLLRNSLDHGIETPEARTLAGKSARGKLILSMTQSESGTGISIRDDGRGIDSNAIAKSAVNKGLLTESEVSSKSHEELIDLIFMPGFSTRSEATETSGRGYGMDVVKVNVNELGGDIQVSTELGKGTEFTIKLKEDELQMTPELRQVS
jgi:chemotaxis protein histidine kinase CheA